MPVRTLPQIDCREVKAEHIDRPPQKREPRGNQGRGMIGGKRGFDNAEIGLQRISIAIRFARRNRMRRSLGAGEFEQGCREPGINADQGAPVWFVVALRVLVAGTVRQGLQLRRATGEPHGDRHLAAQQMNFGQVMAQHHLALAAQRQDQCLGVDVWIAVAIAADPGAHPEKGGDMQTAEPVFKLGIKLRDLLQEGRLVITEHVLDLVANAQTRISQEPRLPELRDPRTQQ